MGRHVCTARIVDCVKGVYILRGKERATKAGKETLDFPHYFLVVLVYGPHTARANVLSKSCWYPSVGISVQGGVYFLECVIRFVE